MSINPNTTYKSFLTFRYAPNPNILWVMRGQFSGDLIAGLLISINVMNNDDRNDPYNNNIIDAVEVIYDRGTSEFSEFFELKTDIILENYIIAKNITRDNMNNYHPEVDSYGWWLIKKTKSSPTTRCELCSHPQRILDPQEKELYTLVSFRTAEFIQGFISTCNAYNIDFRDYVLGSPFKYIYETQQIINYTIEGYDLEPYNVIRRIPAPIGAYYIDRNEADVAGVDFE
jgi:hypothetical protein